MVRTVILLLLAAANLVAQAEQAEWLTDLGAAQQKAKHEGKGILLDFTGSDWCGWCMRLKREVFDRPQFAEFANANLVLVEVDFPRKKQLSQAQLEANGRLAEQYHIQGYPTLILLDRDGRKIGELGYQPGGPRVFNEKVAQLLKVELPDAAPSPQPSEPPLKKRVVYQPVPPGVPIRYEALALKGVSGSQQRRLALINNETFMVGETAFVKVQDHRVEVRCKEIRQDSVLITADGKPLELKLGAP